ncbi:hypothetical protein RTP6_005460 [Batrachochytrium dendrobatidis]
MSVTTDKTADASNVQADVSMMTIESIEKSPLSSPKDEPSADLPVNSVTDKAFYHLPAFYSPISIAKAASLAFLQELPTPPNSNTAAHNGLYENLPYNDAATDLSNRLTSALWQQVFLYLVDNPETIKTLSSCSQAFHHICMEPVIRGHILLSTYGAESVFHRIYTMNPNILSFELAETLSQYGALLPKFFIEQAYRNSIDGTIPLPAGTSEFFVAHGYRRYGDRLLISGIDPMDIDQKMEWMDDSDEFILECGREPIDMNRIKIIVQEHLYVPALNINIFRNKSDTDVLWESLCRLAIADANMTYYIASRCGTSFEIANDAIMMRVLRDTKWEKHQLDRLLDIGFTLSFSAVVPLLIDAKVMTERFGPIRSFLTEVFPKDHILAFVEDAFYELFRSNHRNAVRIADFLISEFNIPEHNVARAFLAHPYDVREMRIKRRYILPMSTTFGVNFGGMSDAIWPVLVTRYGLNHTFVEACITDLLVGGTVNVFTSGEDDSIVVSKPNLKPASALSENSNRNSIGPLRQRPNATTDSGRMLFQWMLRQRPPDLNEEAEMATRDSLNAVFDLGIPIRPTSTFPAVAHMIFTCRKVAPRFLQYMAHVEQGLLKLSALRSSHDVFVIPDWLQIFHNVVLDDAEWINALPTDSVASMMAAAEINSESDLVVNNSHDANEPESPISTVSGVASSAAHFSATGSMLSYNQAQQQPVISRSKSFFSSMGLLQSLNETVRMMDPREAQWKDIRRFYMALYELSGVLKEDLRIQAMQKRSTFVADRSTFDLENSTPLDTAFFQKEQNVNDGSIADGLSKKPFSIETEHACLDEQTPAAIQQINTIPVDMTVESTTNNHSASTFKETISVLETKDAVQGDAVDRDEAETESALKLDVENTNTALSKSTSDVTLNIEDIPATPLLSPAILPDSATLLAFKDRTNDKSELTINTRTQLPLLSTESHVANYDTPQRRELLQTYGGMGPFQQWFNEVEAEKAVSVMALDDRIRSGAANIPASHISLISPTSSHTDTKTLGNTVYNGSDTTPPQANTSPRSMTVTAMNAVSSTTLWVRNWFSH